MLKFNILVDQNGKRYIYFLSDDIEEKIIDDFERIPFDPQGLFDDMMQGFCDFSYLREHGELWMIYGHEYDDNGVLRQLDIEWRRDTYTYKFREIVDVELCEEGFASVRLKINDMKEEERQFFLDFANVIEEYCIKRGIDFDNLS